MRLTITDVRQQAADIRSIELLPSDRRRAGHTSHGLQFVPGQVAVLKLGGLPRPAYFALSGAPEDAALHLLVKRGGDAATRIYEMSAGDEIEMEQIAGRGFPLQEFAKKDLIFIAMGTGIAPLRSALRSALKAPDDFGRLAVLYGVRTPDDFCYRDEVEEWRARGVELRQVISQPTGYDWAGPTGYVQSLLDNLLPALSEPVALVAGSREMIEQTRERLHKMNFTPDRILTNY